MLRTRFRRPLTSLNGGNEPRIFPPPVFCGLEGLNCGIERVAAPRSMGPLGRDFIISNGRGVEPTRALKARPTLLTDVVPLQIPMFLFFGVQFRGRLPDVSFDKHISGLIILAVATTASVSHN